MTPRPRILRYYPRAASGDGGITNSVRLWSEACVRAGVDVSIGFDEGTPRPEWGDTGVEWLPIRHVGRSRWKVPVGFEQALKRCDLLILHSAWALHNNWAARAAKRIGVPYVLEPRGAYDPQILRRHAMQKACWWRAFEQHTVRNAGAIHVFFPAEQKHLRALGYESPFIIAPNGVTVPLDLHWNGGKGGYFLWMGRFDPEHKGLDLLIQAVALLRPVERPTLRLQGPAWRDGKDRAQALIHQLGLSEWIHIADKVHGRAKFETLVNARGFIYPSRWEAFGNSVAEAVALGVPTLTTPYPLGQYLQQRGGALMSEATPHRLAQGLRALASSQAEDISKRGAEIVREEFTWDRAARRWLEQAVCLPVFRTAAAHESMSNAIS